MGDGELDELVMYTELCDLAEKQCEREEECGEDMPYAYIDITKHEGPLSLTDTNYKKGSKYKHWETGEETTWEPTYTMSKEDPIYSMARMQRRMGYIRREKKYQCMQNQVVKRSRHNAPIFKCGVQEIPRDSQEVKKLDEENSNTLWQDRNHVE